MAEPDEFLRSPDFQDRGYFAFRFYATALGRNPSYAEFIPDIARLSGFLNPAELEANKVAFVNNPNGNELYDTQKHSDKLANFNCEFFRHNIS